MPVKIAILVVLMLLYPLFLRWVHITDLRAIPLVVPYALGALSVMVLLTELGKGVARLFRRRK
ncbi:hypothetical protein [Paenibacillus tyrfis]|uniref:Cation-transporting P-type ATPase C-terminal domain-containing protein n=1 Tax=Paenibacillus tyrfis TaxID=1501230 RepID=A0A081P566_9BACL|nr:hypothetical protein [Paenibacillus tyrfis]KEQ25839.1 hypothetical protein ET33_37355 [Paenibacillus tyrfis]